MMKTFSKNKLAWFTAISEFCLPFVTARADFHADSDAGPRGVDIPVVVNVLGATDPSDPDPEVQAIITVSNTLIAANEILKQANIRLISEHINTGVQVGNGDGRLSESEYNEVMFFSLNELMPDDGPGKGIKINIAKDVSVEDPDLTSWSDYFLPVIFLESSVPPEQMGRALAHELSFGLGLDDVEDVTNLMSHDGAGTLMNLPAASSGVS